MSRLLHIFDAQQLWRKQVVTQLGDGPLATTATTGFFYIPSCPGTPTGVPVASVGLAPMVWDSTNHLLYVYDGSWRAVGP